MSIFKVRTKDAGVYSAPDLTASRSGVAFGTEVEAEPVAGRANWVKTTAPAGFMRVNDLEAEAVLAPEPVEGIEKFCIGVGDAARALGVDRDYLLAVAWAESDGLKSLGGAGDAAIGPFRFTAENWQTAMSGTRAAPYGLTAAGRRRWMDQPPAAALFAVAANEALTAKLGKAPTLGMLYFAHVFGVAAAETLLGGLPGAPGALFREAFVAAFGDAAYGPVLAARGALLAGASVSVGGVLDGLGAGLDAAYGAVAQVLDGQREDIRFFHAEQDDPPWLKVAREEQFRGVFEYPGADNNARISQYLSVAGLKASADEVPWCGAFVAYCMKQCGDAAAAGSVPKDAVRAASWLGWGREAPTDARGPGTVVVLRPQAGAAGSSGHVGFLVQDAGGEGAPAGMLRLLAGNQGKPQRVCTLDVSEKEVAAGGYRMAGFGVGGVAAVGVAPVAGPVVAPAVGPVVGGAGRGFRALVPGGFFSGDPNSHALRSIRTNNPGALNYSSWQPGRKGYFGVARPDNSANRNVTTIYLTPEHGAASWFTLLAVRYGLGRRFGLRTLGARYSGRMGNGDVYVSHWVRCSDGSLTADTVVDTGDDEGMLHLAKAMFRNEGGPTPLSDAQIRFGIQHERAGTLPD